MRAVGLGMWVAVAGGGCDPYTGSVFPGPGTTNAYECICALPDFTDLECQRGEVADGRCVTRSFADGEPCRGGLGTCLDGRCSGGERSAPTLEACASALDCNDGDPCTIDSCPDPGCDSCYHAPMPDPGCVATP